MQNTFTSNEAQTLMRSLDVQYYAYQDELKDLRAKAQEAREASRYTDAQQLNDRIERESRDIELFNSSCERIKEKIKHFTEDF